MKTDPAFRVRSGVWFARYRWLPGLAALLPAFALGAPDPAAFRFVKEVRTGRLQREELIAVTLDSEVYAHTRDRLPDLRLLDAEGRDVPFLLKQATETRRQTVRKTWPVEPQSAKPLDEGGLEIDLSLDPADPQPSGLTLMTPLRNFEQGVQVFGSNDGQSWELLVADALLFDYSRFFDIRNREVRLPKNDYRRFRVVVEKVTAEQESELMELTRRLQGDEELQRQERVLRERRPFRIDRVEFWRETVEDRMTGPATEPYPIAEFTAEHDAEHKQTVLTIHTRREPLTAFELETPARNFTRPVVVERPESRGVRTEWQRLGEATLLRFAFRELNREELEVEFPETRSEQYRLVIDDRDNPPLEVTGVRATGNVYRLVYFAAQAGRYRLVYGSETVKAPQYDTTAISASLREGYEPVPAELGEAVEQPGAGRPATRFRTLVNNPVVLIAVVCVLVAILGCVLYTAARRVNALSPDTSEPPGGP